MAVNTKAIKRRLKSVKNTKKITKAMELVAAAKMRHAVEAALGTRSYAMLARELLAHVSKTEALELPLLEVREIKNMLVVLFTSNRGLCGSFNSNIIRKSFEYMKQSAPNSVHIEVIAVGKKGGEAARRGGYSVVASTGELSDTPGLTDIIPVTKIAIDGYRDKTYDKVVVAYTDFQSALRQIPRVRQLLPISQSDIDAMVQGAANETESASPVMDALEAYLFEPNPIEVLDMMLPRLVEMQVYQAILESAASEHSARMMAMRNASDAAGDMIFELDVTYNKARQAGITQEIAEIAGGAAALG